MPRRHEGVLGGARAGCDTRGNARAQTERVRVLQIGLNRSDDDPCVDADEIDASNGHAAPAIYDDPFVEHSVEHIDEARVLKLDVTPHTTRVRGGATNSDRSSRANTAKAHQRDNRTMTIRNGGIGAARVRAWEGL